MKKSTISIPVLCLGLCLSVAAFSSPTSSSGSNAVKGNLAQACKSDVQKFCSDITPGKGRVMACLKSHDDKLSDNCSHQWTQAKAQFKSMMKGMRTACGTDMQKFCGDAEGPHAIGSCLSNHDNDLSASCKNFREQNNMTS